MLTVIIGGSGSGKSELAEGYVLGMGERKNYYIATMHPDGAEGAARVRRHQDLRRGKPFETIECFRGAGSLVFPQKGAALLECLSNLTANELFDGPGDQETDWYVEKLLLDMEKLEGQCSHLTVVTNDVFCDGVRYEEETMKFLEVLGRVNAGLARRADTVIEAVAGLADYRKGGPMG